MLLKYSKFVLCLLLLVISSSLAGEDKWQSWKDETLLKSSEISGWCGAEKALLMMDLIKENRCKKCVEIGVFSGKSLFPIARALKYQGFGKVYAIDAWNAALAIEGFDSEDPNCLWWSQINFDFFYQSTCDLIKTHKLRPYCSILRKSSEDALSFFEDESIDFIHFDGNHNERCVTRDVSAYFPKVRDKGYILLNDPNWMSMRQALIYLLERADLVSSFSPSATYFLFRKNSARIKNANLLMDP